MGHGTQGSVDHAGTRMRPGGAAARGPRAGAACSDRAARPQLVVIAGANGAGKSTYTTYLRERGASVIDPDAIARALSPEEPTSVRMSAGRAALRLAHEQLALSEEFGIETTLSGQGAIRLMRAALERGFAVDLAYLGTDDVEINLTRIRGRVALGGHDVAETDVRRRYERSLANLSGALELVDFFVLIDNTLPDGFEIFAQRDAQGTRVYREFPSWAAHLIPLVERDLTH